MRPPSAQTAGRRLPEIVDDQEGALPSIDVAGQGPSPIARHNEEWVNSPGGDTKRELSESAHAAFSHVVHGRDVWLGRGAVRTDAAHEER
jgi:hypothetical protein